MQYRLLMLFLLKYKNATTFAATMSHNTQNYIIDSYEFPRTDAHKQ